MRPWSRDTDTTPSTSKHGHCHCHCHCTVWIYCSFPSLWGGCHWPTWMHCNCCCRCHGHGGIAAHCPSHIIVLYTPNLHTAYCIVHTLYSIWFIACDVLRCLWCLKLLQNIYYEYISCSCLLPTDPIPLCLQAHVQCAPQPIPIYMHRIHHIVYYSFFLHLVLLWPHLLCHQFIVCFSKDPVSVPPNTEMLLLGGPSAPSPHCVWSTYFQFISSYCLEQANSPRSTFQVLPITTEFGVITTEMFPDWT